MKYLLITSALIISFSTSFAQGWRGQGGEPAKIGVVSGSISDENDAPLEYANVIIYSQKDSSLVTGGITNVNGEFAIEEVPFGRFYLEANFIGYNKKIVPDLKVIPGNTNIEVGNISLGIAQTELQEIEIVGEKNPIEYHIDKKVVNVSSDLTAAGGSVARALENVPSVRVDLEGNVSLRGSSNFRVFVDGRPSVLQGSDALQQIPASAVENVEIITNPSAKYDPDGVGGIINIVMKKNIKTGLNGVINTMVGVRDKYSADGLFNYRAGKFNFFLGANWNDQSFLMNRISDRTTFRNDSAFVIESNGDGIMRRRGYDVNGGFDFNMTEKSTLSFSGSYGYFGWGRDSDTYQKTFSNPSTETDYLVNISESLRDGNFINFNLNFQHKFDKKGHEISALAFWSHQYNQEDNDNNDEFQADANWQLADDLPYRIYTNEIGSSDEYRLQIDYTKPLKNGKFEVGMQYRRDLDAEDFIFQEYDNEGNEWIDNPLFTNSNNFERNITSGYFQFSNKLMGFEYQLGLRGEYTDRSIRPGNPDKTYVVDQVNFFPTVHLTRQISKTDQIQGGYSRRINRPRGYYLEPFISFYNRFTYRRGNPNIMPEFVNSFELNYQKRFGASFISLESYFRETQNAITRTQGIYSEQDNIMLLEYKNVNTERAIGAEVMANWEVTDWLRLNPSVNMYQYEVQGTLQNDSALNRDSNLTDVSVARSSFNYDLRLNGTAKITPTTRLQLIGMYNGPSATAQGNREGFYMVNAAVRQDFFDGKLSATFQAQNIFDSMRFKINSEGSNFQSLYMFVREARIFQLTLSWKINNYKSKEKGGYRDGGGMDFGGDDF